MSLLSIVHDIYKSFDCNPPLEVEVFFYTFLKPLTEIDMMGWYIKLSHLEYDTPLKLTENFLSNRYQSVVLNVQFSSWVEVSAGVPQWSILGPLFFLMYSYILTILAVDYHQQPNVWWWYIPFLSGPWFHTIYQ